MKVDQVNGGIEVSNADDNPEKIVDNSSTSNSTELQVYKRMRPKQGLAGIGGKRETGKSDQSSQVPDKNPIQNSRQRSELTKNLDEQCGELSISADGTKKSPIQIARQRSELGKNLDEQCKELSVSADGIKKSPIQIARQRSELGKNLDEQCKELSVSADGIKKSPIQIRKTRSELNKELNVSVHGTERSPIQRMRTRSVSKKGSNEASDGMERSPIQLRKVKSESNKSDGNKSNAELRKVKSDAGKALDESVNGSERNSIQLVKAKEVSDKVFDESSGNLTSLDDSRKVVDGSAEGIKKNPTGIGFDENGKEFGECEEKVITINLGNLSEVKSPTKLEVTDDDDDWDEELEDEEIETEIEIEKKSFHVKEILRIPELKTKKIVVEGKNIHQTNVKPVPISTKVKKQLPPVVNHPRIISKPTETEPIPFADRFDAVPETNSKLQSLVDLVMWRDASKSAFIFGLGTFIIVSSSYTTDLNISLISIISYLGLVYLGAIFLFRSIIFRGAMDVDDTNQEHVVGEEAAIWLVKLVLPYVNEFLLKLRALFSGDPATTMKLAVLLFVLARCGSSLTVWKIAKLGFFGVFTLPKICSSYSSRLSAYGTFWIRRFRDAWESCSHKKALGFFFFTLVWNLSSIIARIWAVFLLVVAFRYYQYSLMKEEEDWIIEEAAREEGSSVEEKHTYWQGKGHRRGQGRGPTLLEIINKQKKGS